MQDERSSFKGLLTIDETTLAPRGFLRHGRLKGILFQPPCASHGAVGVELSCAAKLITSHSISSH